jgi:hypothetical protein
MAQPQRVPEQTPRPNPAPDQQPPHRPKPELKIPPTPAKPEVGDDQGDSGPDVSNPITQDSEKSAPVDREDAHIGATENQVSDTSAPAGDAFEDEPKQG